MSASAPPVSAPAAIAWRTPLVIILAGGLCAMLTFGPRASFGFFTQEFSSERGWALAIFSLSAAIQNLLWGLGQPFAGALADKYGTTRVLSGGALIYAAGLAWTAFATDPVSLHLSAGVLIGVGLAGCSFNIVLAAFSKLLPAEKRGLALGIGSASGSFGQFLFAPLTVLLKDTIGWQPTLVAFAVAMIAILPLSLVLMTPKADGGAQAAPGAAAQQTLKQALAEAFGHRSYNLLVAGFFVCGFHIAFITIHLPKYLVENGIPVAIGGWVMALVGLFNIIGSLSAGLLGNRMPKPYILSAIYALRSVAIVLFILLPLTPVTAIGFGIAIGLLWLSTVPPTSALVAVFFGARWMAMLYGIVFFSHQVGAFLGVWLAGVLYDSSGSYDIVWWLGIALGVFAALVHLPIAEKPVARLLAAKPA